MITREQLDKLIRKKHEEIERHELMYLDLIIQEWVYTQESITHKNISKIEALEKLGQCQANLKEYKTYLENLQKHLEVYKTYAKEHDI